MDKLFGIGPNGLNNTGARSASIQILTTDWSNLTCTKTVSGMTSDLAVVISPEASSIDGYSKAGIKCTAQGTNSLTFTCKAVPTENITINVLMVAVMKEGGGLNRLEVSGNWTNNQYAGAAVDYTGLTFTAVFNDGSSRVVIPTDVSPAQWSSTVGTQTCTFSYTQDGITVSATKSANVQVNPINPVLNNNSWEKIKSVADAGTASQYWSVGDYKEVSVAAGTVDNMSVTAGTYRAVIIGINHNPTYENPNSIDFAIGQNTSGTDICFGGYPDGVRMNTSNGTTGGWTGSQMYLTYLPQFYNLLSGNTGLQSAMIAPKKYTNNVGGGTAGDIESAVTLSENANYKMFLMSEFEIFGVRTEANSYEQYKQMQYAYYSSSGLAKSKIRYRTDTVDASYWWERSARCAASATVQFCTVYGDGSTGYQFASIAIGLVPCFRV